jgi:GNAT superfamily N-acetyltransferase
MDSISESLDERHVLTSFSCGKEPLDRWLRQSAARGGRQDTGRTFVMHNGDGVVLGYYTLAGHLLYRDGLSLSRTEARSVPAELPAILLAKLAVDVTLQGQGFGRELLVEALSKCVAAGSIAASRYVVVDAKDEEAASSYARYGFRPIPQTDPVRLLRRLKDITADLSASS